MARKGFERQGPLPTVSHYKGHELRQLLVICRSDRIPGYLCSHTGRLPLDGLPDVDLFELERRLKFRCPSAAAPKSSCARIGTRGRVASRGRRRWATSCRRDACDASLKTVGVVLR
jgi:hypothetical protein